jgi:hypothetical protein
MAEHGQDFDRERAESAKDRAENRVRLARKHGRP